MRAQLQEKDEGGTALVISAQSLLNGTAKGFSRAITYQLCLSSKTAGARILQPRRVSAGGSDVPQILTECLLCLVLFQVNGERTPAAREEPHSPGSKGSLRGHTQEAWYGPETGMGVQNLGLPSAS